MPLTHTRTFKIRQYECDVNGHMNSANYLRFMQETAFDASAAAGYDQDKYRQLHRTWYIRETEIEYVHPLVYEDIVSVKTWVQDFRRVSSRRRYEFYNHETGNLVASAFTDWAYLDTDTGKPVLIPAEMIDAFFPEGAPASYPLRDPFISPPPPAEKVFKWGFQTSWKDIDVMGHANNAVYIDWMNECSMKLMSAYGWSWRKMNEKGIGMFAHKVNIIYRRAALLEDELEFSTWAYNMKRSTGTRYYELRRVSDAARIAQINAYAVWVDLETGKPIRIPDEMLIDFSSNIVSSLV